MSKNPHTITIKPKGSSFLPDLKELYRYRELLIIFAWRNIKVRYKQTVLGILWVILQPLMSTFIFTVFFGKLAKVPSGDLPYPLFVLTGLVFWNFFSQSLTNAANSFISNEHLIKKVYFPRLILPLSSVITSSIDFVINLALLLLASLYFSHPPTLSSLWIVPLGFLITFIAASGLGTLLASINVKYRDVRYILPFFIQLLIFVAPVIYPTSIVRESNQFILALNPMTGVIEAVRSSLAFSSSLNTFNLAISSVAAVLALILGLVYFNLTEKFFADIT